MNREGSSAEETAGSGFPDVVAPRVSDRRFGPRADVLLVTVTDVEITSVLTSAQRLSGKPYTTHFAGRKTYYNVGPIGDTVVYLVRSEMGSTGLGGSLLTVWNGIDLLRPTAVIMVGIAFGMDDTKQSIGTVLISRQIHNYDLTRIGMAADGEVHVISRGDRPHASPLLIDRFRDGHLTWRESPIEFGLLLSGSALVDNLDYREQLRKLAPEAIGGEMEGAGLYVGAEEHKTDWIVAKGVCDYADGHKRAEKDKRQGEAARCASDFVFHVISQGGLAAEAISRAPDKWSSTSTRVPPAVVSSLPPTASDQPVATGSVKSPAVAPEASPAVETHAIAVPTTATQPTSEEEKVPDQPPRTDESPSGAPPARQSEDRATKGGNPWSRFIDGVWKVLAARSVSRVTYIGDRAALYQAWATGRGDFAVEALLTEILIDKDGAVVVDHRYRYRAGPLFNSIRNGDIWEAPILPGGVVRVFMAPENETPFAVLGPTFGVPQDGRPGHSVDWIVNFAHSIADGESVDIGYHYTTEPGAARFNVDDVDSFELSVKVPIKSAKVTVKPVADAPFVLVGARAIAKVDGGGPLIESREESRVLIALEKDGGYQYSVEYPLPGSLLRFVWAIAPKRG